MLIIPLAAKGVTRRRMENSGVNASGSTFIEFDDVEVPAENLIGIENDGFRYIMSSKSPMPIDSPFHFSHSYHDKTNIPSRKPT